MKKLAFPLSLTALALLAACGTTDRATPAPVVVAPQPTVVVTQPAPQVVTAPVVVQPAALRAGHGRIESILAQPPSAAAGGSTLRRVANRMDDGSMQWVDTAASGLSIGERVELTSDGQIRH